MLSILKFLKVQILGTCCLNSIQDGLHILNCHNSSQISHGLKVALILVSPFRTTLV